MERDGLHISCFAHLEQRQDACLHAMEVSWVILPEEYVASDGEEEHDEQHQEHDRRDSTQPGDEPEQHDTKLGDLVHHLCRATADRRSPYHHVKPLAIKRSVQFPFGHMIRRARWITFPCLFRPSPSVSLVTRLNFEREKAKFSSGFYRAPWQFGDSSGSHTNITPAP